MKKKLTCHCGAIEIEANFPNGLDKLMRRNCAICKKKGAIMTAVNLNDLKVIKGQDKIKTYQFNTNVAKHYFCSICGIYTHHNPRSNPLMTGFNLGCIEDIDTFELEDIKINDGKNHPLDKN